MQKHKDDNQQGKKQYETRLEENRWHKEKEKMMSNKDEKIKMRSNNEEMQVNEDTIRDRKWWKEYERRKEKEDKRFPEASQDSYWDMKTWHEKNTRDRNRHNGTRKDERQWICTKVNNKINEMKKQESKKRDKKRKWEEKQRKHNRWDKKSSLVGGNWQVTKLEESRVKKKKY